MIVKQHYDNHLGDFYSWLAGDFDTNMNSFKQFCIDNKIESSSNGFAIDLGAGHGIQSIALAQLGFRVLSVDFNAHLLNELRARIGSYPIEIVQEDIRTLKSLAKVNPDLIVCCGDTLPHLESVDEIRELVIDSCNILKPQGKLILIFRDYSVPLEGDQRFIPVKSDQNRILTCFLEYFDEKVRVTDLLNELQNGKWIQKVSSYFKTKISKEIGIEILKDSGFEITLDKVDKGVVSLIGVKL